MAQEVRKRPPLAVVHPVRDGDEPVALILGRDNRSSKTLLFLALSLFDFVHFELATPFLNERFLKLVLRDELGDFVLRSTVAVLELALAAAKARVIATYLGCATDIRVWHP